MILTEERKKRLIELLENIPETNWGEIEKAIINQQPKVLEIHTYLQKMYEDDKFCLIANFFDNTDNKLDFIEFKDKRNRNNPKVSVWDNNRWWDGVLMGNPESTAILDGELLPIVQQFLRQILKPINND